MGAKQSTHPNHKPAITTDGRLTGEGKLDGQAVGEGTQIQRPDQQTGAGGQLVCQCRGQTHHMKDAWNPLFRPEHEHLLAPLQSPSRGPRDQLGNVVVGEHPVQDHPPDIAEEDGHAHLLQGKVY